MAETKFLGFQQVSKAYFDTVADADKKGYLWFVREIPADGSTDPIKSSIYFGTRLYAQVNETDATLTEKVDSIVESLGEMVDENGDFQGFLPTSAHTILGATEVTDVTTALEALEAAILENKVDISGKVDKVIEGTNGTARIFNEADGGGAKFEHEDGSEAFVGVNDGGKDGMVAQIYADEKDDSGKWVGSRINVYNKGIFYQSKEDTANGVAKDAAELEIAVKGDIDALASNIYTKEETDSKLDEKVDKEMVGANGTAYIFNEPDGGGAKFVNNDGVESFVGVNDGGENGLVAQIYADKLNGEGKWEGAKIDVTNGGIYYTVGSESFSARAVEGNEIAVKGDIAEVKSELESEISQKVAGLFHFKGVVATVEDLPTEGVQEGDVYQVTGEISGKTDIEYAYVNKGTKENPVMAWVELGAVHDLSAYATKAEVEILADSFEGELDNLDGRVDNLEAKQTLSAGTYTEAAAAISGLTPGQIIYITTDEEGESGHTAGPYIVTESGGLKELKKLESSSGTGETPIDRIENLENTVGIGDKSALGGKTIIEKIVECDSLHQINGDDVEE